MRRVRPDSSRWLLGAWGLLCEVVVFFNDIEAAIAESLHVCLEDLRILGPSLNLKETIVTTQEFLSAAQCCKFVAFYVDFEEQSLTCEREERV